MKQKKGILIIISGLSGTGKNYFQNIIVESSEDCKAVPKYTTRDARIGEDDTSIDFFNVDAEKIQACSWHYCMNGNEYGIMMDDIKSIIETRG